MFREIEKELITYFHIKIRKLNFDFEIPESDYIYLRPVSLCLEARKQTHYHRIDDDEYETSPVNFIAVNIEGIYNPRREEEKEFRLILSHIYLHLDDEAAKIEEIKSSGSILNLNPSFMELINYFKNCLGMRRKDFKELLEKLRLVNVAAV